MFAIDLTGISWPGVSAIVGVLALLWGWQKERTKIKVTVNYHVLLTPVGNHTTLGIWIGNPGAKPVRIVAAGFAFSVAGPNNLAVVVAPNLPTTLQHGESVTVLADYEGVNVKAIERGWGP